MAGEMTTPLGGASPQPSEDFFAQLAALTKLGEDADSFKVKVEYKDGMGALPVQILSIEDVRLKQVRDYEEWLPRLVGGSGGGTHVIAAFHPKFKDGVTPIGKFSFKLAGAPRFNKQTNTINVDWTALEDIDYSGPSRIVQPSPPKTKPIGTISAPPLTSIARGIGADEVSNGTSGGNGAGNGSFSEHVLKREVDVNRRERAVEVEATRREAELREQALKNELDVRLARLETLIATAAKPAPAPQPSIVTPELILGGLKLMSEESAQKREEDRRRWETQQKLDEERRRDERESRQREREEERRREDARLKADEDRRSLEREARKQELELLAKLNEKKGADVEGTAKVFDTMARMAQQNADTQSALLGAMHTMMMSTMKMMSPEADQDSELVKMTKAIFAGLRGSLGGSTEASQRVLAIPATAGSDGTAQQEQQARQPQQAEELPPLPAGLVPVEQAIHAMKPAKEVAVMVITAFKTDAAFQQLLVSGYKDNLEALFGDYFGEWVEADLTARGPYAQELFQEVLKAASAAQASSTPAAQTAQTGTKKPN